MPALRFAGCTPVPLLSYLKAVGILRLLAEQTDPEAAGAWHDDRFVVETRRTRDEVERFFLAEYRPTPILGPWAGGSGFFTKDNREAVEAIAASEEPRLARLRETIVRVTRVLDEEGLREKPSGDEKLRLLKRLRATLPDEALLWLDAAFVITDDASAAAPLLGSGGNDGRLDFGRNYLERLVELGFATGTVEASASLLREALFGSPVKGLGRSAVGQFDPGGAGGPNATTGMEADSLLNPWDWVLGLEGALLFGGASSRRYQWSGERARPSFPFTVSAVPVGDNLPSETEKTRGEIWLPLWKQPVTLAGVRHLLTEGRLSLGRRQAGDGVESARAVATLGVQRGVAQFVRYGLYERHGRNYLATVMGRFPVQSQVAVRLLEWGAAGRWLQRYRWLAAGAPRHARALRRLDSVLIDLTRYGGAARVNALLRALGACERELALGPAPGQVTADRSCPPLPLLDLDWLRHADDGSVEFRLAKGLASIGAHSERPLRADLEPVEGDQDVRWAATSNARMAREPRVANLLTRLLERRLIEGGLTALHASASVPLVDVVEFLAGSTDDAKLLELLWGLACVRPAQGAPRGHRRRNAVPVPRAYAALRLMIETASLPVPQPEERDGQAGASVSPLSAAAPQTATARRVLGLLRAGDVDGAVVVASRRLRTASFPILPGRDNAGRERAAHFVPQPDPMRLAASLLLPLAESDTRRLAGLVRLERHGDEAAHDGAEDGGAIGGAAVGS